MATIEQLAASAKTSEQIESLIAALETDMKSRLEENPFEQIMLEMQPKQKLLWNEIDSLSGKWIGYGGARGGAKSAGLRRAMLLRRYKYPNTVGVLFRKTFDDLRDNHISPLWVEYPFLRKYYKVQNKELTLPNGSRILFVHEENEKDFIETFQGKNYDDIFVDEATHLKESQIVYMSTACRTVQLGIKSKFVLSMNPGGTSHSFIKRIFIDRKYVENEDPKEYTFIQAYGWDNVMWVRSELLSDGLTPRDYYTWDDNKKFDYFVERSDYGRDLNRLPDNDRKAHLFGDWHIFAGQFFNMFSEKNIIRQSIQREYLFPACGAIDYGKRTVLEVAQRNYEGVITFTDEVYTDSGSATERANMMADNLLEKRIYDLDVVCDRNMGYALQDGIGRGESMSGVEHSPIAIFEEVFRERFAEEGLAGKEPKLRLVSKKSSHQYGYRVMCNESIKDFLKRELLKFTIDCPMAIQTIPELVYSQRDKNGMDFDDKIGIDDPYDACKYAFMELYTPVEPATPLPKWVKELKEDTPKIKGRSFMEF